MRQTAFISSALLLICALHITDVNANRGLPVPPKPVCEGTCCQTRGSVSIARFCGTQYAIFTGGDTVLASTVMSSLVSSLSAVTFANKRADAACVWRNVLSQRGVDFRSFRTWFKDDAPVPAGNNNFVSGGAAVFSAGSNVYVVFSGIFADEFSGATENYQINGQTVQVNALFYNYYKLYTQTATDSVINEAIRQYNALPAGQTSNNGNSKNGNPISTPPKRIFVGGFSAGGTASLFAALDLQAAGITADGVYSFGNSKPGYKNFVDAYVATAVGAKTTVWWNRKDVLVVMPPADAAQAEEINQNLPDEDDSVDEWGTDANYVRLPGSKYWRIAPETDITTIPEGKCVKVKDDNDAWYDACPSQPRDAGNYSCGLNSGDHDMDAYHDQIKKCALDGFDKNRPPRRGVLNPTCFNKLALPDGF